MSAPTKLAWSLKGCKLRTRRLCRSREKSFQEEAWTSRLFGVNWFCCRSTTLAYNPPLKLMRCALGPLSAWSIVRLCRSVQPYNSRSRARRKAGTYPLVVFATDCQESVPLRSAHIVPAVKHYAVHVRSADSYIQCVRLHTITLVRLNLYFLYAYESERWQILDSSRNSFR